MTSNAAIISTHHPNAGTYRRAADAFRAGDLDTLATTGCRHPRRGWPARSTACACAASTTRSATNRPILPRSPPVTSCSAPCGSRRLTAGSERRSEAPQLALRVLPGHGPLRTLRAAACRRPRRGHGESAVQVMEAPPRRRGPAGRISPGARPRGPLHLSLGTARRAAAASAQRR